ncbi:MAG: phosphate/phosphite/phosphonate ABC transporter substrate-binding protein [Bacteroidales bacterium]
MRNYIFLFIISGLLILNACQRNPKNVQVVDFENTSENQSRSLADEPGKTLKVAVSAILSPKETYDSYEQLFRYISQKLDRDIEFIQRKTYQEINQMLEDGALDFAFICSGAYIELNADNRVELLAIPVSNNKPLYQAYIIVPERSDARAFKDLKNKSFAYTDPISNTGYLYAMHRLHEMNEPEDSFFSSTIFTHGHDISIQMVAKGLVEGATIDGLVFDYLNAKEPERVQDIRVIEESQYFGIPPVVVTNRLDKQSQQQIRDIFLQIHEDPAARELINSLLIDRFIEGNDEDYNSIRQMKASLPKK